MPSEIRTFIYCGTCNNTEVDVTLEDEYQGFVICPTCGTKYILS